VSVATALTACAVCSVSAGPFRRRGTCYRVCWVVALQHPSCGCVATLHSHPAVAPNCMPAVHCSAMTARQLISSRAGPLLSLCCSLDAEPCFVPPSLTPPQARRRSSSARPATRTRRTRRTRRATTTRSSSRTCSPSTTSTSGW
jgi:hypothetical protein